MEIGSTGVPGQNALAHVGVDRETGIDLAPTQLLNTAAGFAMDQTRNFIHVA